MNIKAFLANGASAAAVAAALTFPRPYSKPSPIIETPNIKPITTKTIQELHLAPELLTACKVFEVDLEKVDRNFEILPSELDAAITLYNYLAPEYLAGQDSRFDRGDIDWIASKFKWPLSTFVGNRLSANEDLLEPTAAYKDTACSEPENFSIIDLQAVETATLTMTKFFERMSLYHEAALPANENGERWRYVPSTQEEFKAMMQALLRGTKIPETVSTRIVSDFY